MTSQAVANRSCPRKNTFALILLGIFSLTIFPASRKNLGIFSTREAVSVFHNLLSLVFPLIFRITSWTQYSGVMLFHTRTPTAKHILPRGIFFVLNLSLPNFMWCSLGLVWEKTGTGHFPSPLISANASWKSSHVFLMPILYDSFKALGLGRKSTRKGNGP